MDGCSGLSLVRVLHHLSSLTDMMNSSILVRRRMYDSDRHHDRFSHPCQGQNSISPVLEVVHEGLG